MMADHDRNRDAVATRQNGSQRRTAIIAVLMILSATLLMIALATYDPRDEANADIHLSDLVGVLTGDPAVRAKADTANNGLGLVGAIISDALVKSTIGYAVYVVPLLLFVWGWSLLRRRPPRGAIMFTNYAILLALELSAGFGITRAIAGPGGPGMEWSGIVGDFLASVLVQLLGRAGGSIVLVAGLLLTIVFAADIDLHDVADTLKSQILWILDWFRRTHGDRKHFSERRVPSEKQAKAPAFDARSVTISRPPEEQEIEPKGNRDSEELAWGKRSPARYPDSVPPVSISINEKEIQETDEEARREKKGEKSGSAGATEDIDYVFPSVELLSPPAPGREDVDDEELKANADLLRATLAEFNVELESVSVTPGPVVTLYELVPASGVKISSIVSLESDMALKLAARGIRIMAPIPGKSAVGVEIPNSHRSLVTIRSVINSNAFRDTQGALLLALGKTISGEVYTDDLSRMPHILIAGSTGSGKSVGINTILASLLFRLHPSDLKLVIIDPKKIEMAQYAMLRDHFLAISPDIEEQIITTPRNAVVALRGVELEMERRYDRLASAGVRSIVDYNERLAGGRLRSTDEVSHQKMPYLLVVIDELADLMITAAREVEEPIARLAQLARAVGIHLIVATQRPSVDVITGVIKANFPARIAYQVASKTDSRTILDMNGAEQLLGNGDMLYLASGSPKPIRLQNAFISVDEVDAIVNHIGSQKGYTHPFTLPSILERKKSGDSAGGMDRDELFDEAARLVVRHQQGSVSLLQRRLKVGYSRAARLVDELEAAGVVGAFDGSKARDVLVESEAELDALLNKS
jgi:S-DNA-T family DNA segregation ATPase FtsK/SpoIIIE